MKFFKYENTDTGMFKKQKQESVDNDALLSNLAKTPEPRTVKKIIKPTEQGQPLSLNDIGTFGDAEMTKLLIKHYGSIGTRGRSFTETIRNINNAENTIDEIIETGWEKYSPQQLNYMREGFEDRMNSIQRLLKNEEGAKAIMKHYDPNISDEQFDEFAQSQLDEYARLEMLHQATVGVLNNSMANAGFIRRNITSKSHNVLLDVMDITDMGDVASTIRIGAFTASALTGGATEFTLAGLKSVLATEGAVGAIEATVDTLRDIEANPDENMVKSFAKNWGINTAMNVGTRYAFAGLGKIIRGGANKIKNAKNSKIENAIADAMADPNIKPDGTLNLDEASIYKDYITPEVESVPLIRATEKAYDDYMGAGYGNKMSFTGGYKEGEIVTDAFEDLGSKYYGEKSLAIDVGGTVPTERWAMAEAVQETITNRGIKDITPEKNLIIAGEPDVVNVARKKVQTLKEQSMEHYQNIAFNQAREVSEYSQINKMDIAEISSPTSESARTFVQNVKRTFQEAERVVDDQFYSKIVSLGGEDGITSISDFYGMAKELDIDLDKALYTGELGVEAPEGFKRVFSYFREQYNNNVVGARASMIYSPTDKVYQIAQEFGLENKIFKISDYTPDDWGFADAPLRIDPNINPESLRGIINDSLKPEAIIDTLTEEMALNGVTLSQNALRELRNIVGVEGKIPSKKQITSFLKANGVPEDTAKVISKPMESLQKLRKADTEKIGELVNAINEEIKVRQGLENRIFSYASKKDILTAKGFRVEKTGTVSERYMPLEEALSKMTPEDQKLYKELVEDFTKSTNSVDANAENVYNLFNVERPSGKSTASLDIRTSTMQDVARAKGIKWNELTPEEQIKFTEKILSEEVLPQQLKKVGQNNIARNGITTAEENIEFYLNKWGVSDDVEIVFNRGAKKFGAGVTEPTTETGGKYIFRIDAPAGMDEETLIGVTRHELQHIYDHKFLGEATENSFKFKNKPTIKGTDAEFKIKNGEKVSIREAVGDFYNNHFYSVSDDNFESSYLTAQMRDRYNSLTPEDRFQGFINYVERSRKDIREGKITTKQLFEYSKGSVPIEEFGMMEALQGKRVVQDGFALKTFRNHQEFEDFIFRMSDRMGKRNSDGNRALRFMEKVDSIKGDMVRRQVGYTKNDIINALNGNKILDMLHKQGLSGKRSDNVRKVMEHYRTALSTTGKLYGETVPDFTNKNVTEGYITSVLIGNRWFKDAIQANVNLATQYVNNGDYKRALVEMFRLFPNSAKYFGQSFSRLSGNVALNINDAVKYLVSDVAGFNYEGRLLAHAGDYLTRVGNIGNKNLNVNKVQSFNEDMLKMAIYGSGLSEKSFIGFSKRIQARSLSGLVTDDIVGNIKAKGWAKQEVLSMLEAPSYEAFSNIQKKMYAFSGYKRENFKEFIQALSRQVEQTKGMNYIPSQFKELKTTLNAGVNELDLVGRVQNNIKGERNSFDYLMSTTKGMLLDSLNKVQVKSYNGVYMNKSLDRQALIKIGGYAMAGSIGASQVATAGWLYSSIKNREIQLLDIDKTYNDFKENPVKFTKNILEAVIGETSFGMLTAPSKAVSIPLKTGAEIIEQSSKKGISYVAVTLGAGIYGATYAKLIKDFILVNGEDKAKAHVKTTNFQKQLNKEFKKNFMEQYPKANLQIRNVYQDELRKDKDIYNFTRMQ